MKQKIFLLAALPCMLMVSCAKEALSPEDSIKGKVFTLEASAPKDIAAATKTSMVEDGENKYYRTLHVHSFNPDSTCRRFPTAYA